MGGGGGGAAGVASAAGVAKVSTGKDFFLKKWSFFKKIGGSIFYLVSRLIFRYTYIARTDVILAYVSGIPPTNTLKNKNGTVSNVFFGGQEKDK